VRRHPGFSAVVVALPDGEIVELLSGRVTMDSLEWVQVGLADGQVGWIAEDYIVPYRTPLVPWSLASGISTVEAPLTLVCRLYHERHGTPDVASQDWTMHPPRQEGRQCRTSETHSLDQTGSGVSFATDDGHRRQFWGQNTLLHAFGTQ
jgi:hypothetical protein